MEVLKEATKAGADAADVTALVAGLISQVRAGGDAALLELTQKFDGVALEGLEVPPSAMKDAYDQVGAETVATLRFAAEQLRTFAAKQLECFSALRCESLPGIALGHRLIPVSSVGAYVPAGRYPLPSTALHSVIPAKVAGVRHVAACSPPSKGHDGVHPAVLVALDIAGVDQVFCMGGAQAIAAFAYGTESVPTVDMIVGPGNKFVTEAKRQILGRVGIDLLAGPSEVLIIADDSADPRWVAVDLLAKCEHDPDSISWLVTTSEGLAHAVLEAIPVECETLGTGAMALQTWEDNGRVVLVDSLDEAVAVSEEFAPEHLQVMTRSDDAVVEQLSNYGSLFVGPYAPVAYGDYVSGTNHTLPDDAFGEVHERAVGRHVPQDALDPEDQSRRDQAGLPGTARTSPGSRACSPISVRPSSAQRGGRDGDHRPRRDRRGRGPGHSRPGAEGCLQALPRHHRPAQRQRRGAPGRGARHHRQERGRQVDPGQHHRRSVRGHVRHDLHQWARDPQADTHRRAARACQHRPAGAAGGRRLLGGREPLPRTRGDAERASSTGAASIAGRARRSTGSA